MKKLTLLSVVIFGIHASADLSKVANLNNAVVNGAKEVIDVTGEIVTTHTEKIPVAGYAIDVAFEFASDEAKMLLDTEKNLVSLVLNTKECYSSQFTASFCIVETAGRMVAVTIEYAGRAVRKPIIFATNVTDELLSKIEAALKNRGESLSNWHGALGRLAGRSLIAVSVGVRVVNKGQEIVLDVPHSMILLVSEASSELVGFAAALPRSVFEQLTDMTPASKPYTGQYPGDKIVSPIFSE